MRAAGLALLVVAACRPLPPAPLVALHDDTAGDRVGTTTGMLILGMAGDIGGGGWGAAFRVRQQVSRSTALGGEVLIGRGDDGERRDVDLIAVRALGQSASPDHGWAALTYGVGASWMSTGSLAINGFGGGAISYPNDYFSPYLQVGVAPVWVARRGDRYGDTRCQGDGCEVEVAAAPRSRLYLLVDGGLVGHLGSRGNRLGVDVGLAYGGDDGFFALSIADSQRFAP